MKQYDDNEKIMLACFIAEIINTYDLGYTPEEAHVVYEILTEDRLCNPLDGTMDIEIDRESIEQFIDNGLKAYQYYHRR